MKSAPHTSPSTQSSSPTHTTHSPISFAHTSPLGQSRLDSHGKGAHNPSSVQVSSIMAHSPHSPPQPSSPHSLPPQSGVQRSALASSASPGPTASSGLVSTLIDGSGSPPHATAATPVIRASTQSVLLIFLSVVVASSADLDPSPSVGELQLGYTFRLRPCYTDLMKRFATILVVVANTALAGWLVFLLLPEAPAEPAPLEAPAKPKAKEESEGKPQFSDEDYKNEVTRIEALVAGKGFTVLLQRPFVVVGDEKPAMVRQRARRTVKWAVDHLKELYFEKDPDEIITIWLLKDDESYYKHAKLFFGDEPDTPFGYYSSSDNAMVMNIATGGGTLVHEIVHPFVAANFPDCPSWFNEGLGSLYEQSSQRDGMIIGLTNWRLAGLQQAIRDGDLPSFATLTATTDHQFYNEDPGTNYAQARYLCYYLQEQGLLKQFYDQFRSSTSTDPTGVKTLARVLKTKDLTAFQRKWEKWVLKLTFP